jgi:hypothetical protein
MGTEGAATQQNPISTIRGWLKTPWETVLLITPSARGQECAQAAGTTTLPAVASLLQAAIAKCAAGILGGRHRSIPDGGRAVLRGVPLQHLGSAFPVYVNCAISGIERVVREVRSALSRRVREEEIARVSATRVIWSELKESVTAILLSCDMVLASKDVPAPMAGRIQVIHDLATLMRVKLAPSEQNNPTG